MNQKHKRNQAKRRLRKTAYFLFMLVFFLINSSPTLATTGDYLKGVNQTSNQLFASDWNNLLADFVDASGDTMSGPLKVQMLSGNNAELKIQSSEGTNAHWGLYNDRSTGEFRFWKNDADVFKLTPTGDLTILGAFSAASLQGSLASTLSATNVSSGLFGNNTGGGNYGFKDNLGIGVASSTIPSIANRLRIDDTTVTTGNLVYFNQSGSTFTGNFLDMNGANVTGSFTGNFLNLRNNGTQKFFVNSNGNVYAAGNVGIGTTNPQSNLDVSSDSPIIRLTDTDGGYHVFGGNAGVLGLSVDAGNAVANSRFTVSVDGGEKFRVDSAGNVGIGTVSPVEKLTMQDGSIMFRESGSVHSMTSYFYQNFVGAIGRISTTNGGTNIWGVSSADSTGLQTRGVIGTTTPSNATPATRFVSYKQSGTTIGSLDDNNTAFQFVNNATALVSILGSGNVGIGTISPANKLHVVSTSAGAETFPIMIQNADAAIGTKAGIAFAASSVTSRYSAVEGIQEDGEIRIGLGFITAAGSTITEKMRINSYGNVGIGTTSPAYKLDVVGDINLSGTLRVGGSPYSSSQWTTSGTNIYYNTGNVGIGTVTPRAPLHIQGGTATTTVVAKINKSTYADTGGHTSFLGFGVEPASWSKGAIGYTRTSSYDVGYLGFYLNNDNSSSADISSTDVRMVINNSGNVGIGTTAPNSVLEIRGAGAGASFRVGNTNAAGTQYISLDNNGAVATIKAVNTQNSTYPTILFNVTNNATTETRLKIASDGNVGIGTTTPGQLLHVYNSNGALGYRTARFDSNDTVNGTRVVISNSGNAAANNYGFISGGSGQVGVDKFAVARLNTDSTYSDYDMMVFDTNGNVAISTTTTNYKLRVEGNGYFANAVNVGAPTNNAHAATKSYVDTTISTAIAGGSGSTVGYWALNGSDISNTNSGNVGIGTTSPRVKLDIVGSDGVLATSVGSGLVLRASSDTNQLLYFLVDPASDVALIQSTLSGTGNKPLYLNYHGGAVGIGSNGDDLYVKDGGNVGIGTTNPAYALDLTASGVARAHTYNLATGSIQSNGSGVRFQSGSQISFDTPASGDTKMYIQATSGNVGVGTTSPVAKLDVRGGDINIDIDKYYKTNTNPVLGQSSGNFNFGYIGGNSYATFDTSNNFGIRLSNTNRFYINSSGNVGIGTTTPDYNLRVQASTGIEGLRIIASDFSPFIIRNTANTSDLMRLDQVGKLAIASSVKFGNTTNTCDSTKTGTIKYDATSGQSYLCDGIRWLNQKNCGLMTDDAGRAYSTVQIGGQCWMAENINIGTMLAAGTTEPNITDNIIEKWCYSNSTSNCDLYGGLYNWNEATRGSQVAGARGICPAGWHIPTDAEFNILEKTVLGVIASPNVQYACNMSVTGWRRCADDSGTDNGGTYGAGKSLKLVGVGSGVGAGDDLVGFAGKLPGGRNTDGSFYYLGSRLYLWSSTPSGSSYAWRRTLFSSFSSVARDAYNRAGGFSVRCLRD